MTANFPPPTGTAHPQPAPTRRTASRRRAAAAVVGGLAIAGLATAGITSWDGAPSATFLRPSASASVPTTAKPPLSVNSTSETDISQLVRQVSPGIVSITVEGPAQTGIFGGGGTQKAAGSGFVLSADGLIATNAHVVNGATSITVGFADGSSKPATLVGMDRSDDLAVIRVQATNLHPLTLGDSSGLQVGQRVVAIGNALDLTGGPTVTEGIVSALGRSISTDTGSNLTGLIQTDASLNHGNSGGPLFDLGGDVVGINAAGADGANNVGFAIPMSTARQVLDTLSHGKQVTRPFLGVVTQDASNGVVVTQVVAGSPAEAAKVQVGDVIVSFNGQKVTDGASLGTAIRKAGADAHVSFEVTRSGATTTLKAVLTTHEA